MKVNSSLDDVVETFDTAVDDYTSIKDKLDDGNTIFYHIIIIYTGVACIYGL